MALILTLANGDSVWLRDESGNELARIVILEKSGGYSKLCFIAERKIRIAHNGPERRQERRELREQRGQAQITGPRPKPKSKS